MLLTLRPSGTGYTAPRENVYGYSPEVYPCLWADGRQFRPNVGANVYLWLRNPEVMLPFPGSEMDGTPTKYWQEQEAAGQTKINHERKLADWITEAKANWDQAKEQLDAEADSKLFWWTLKPVISWKAHRGAAKTQLGSGDAAATRKLTEEMEARERRLKELEAKLDGKLELLSKRQ